jgi:hypothetical protein
MHLVAASSSWDGLHSVIVHLTPVLLLAAPLLVVASLVVRRPRAWSLAGLVLMILGMLATRISVSTGQAAGERAAGVGVVARALIERHALMGEATGTIFTALTLIFAVLVLLPVVLHRALPGQLARAATGIFLVLYAGGAIFLVGTARQGAVVARARSTHASMQPLTASPGHDPAASGAGRVAADGAGARR